MPRQLGDGNYTLTKQEVLDTADNLANMAVNAGHRLPPGLADELRKAAEIIRALVQALDGIKTQKLPGLVLT